MANYYVGIDLGTTETTVSCISIESRRDDPIEKLLPLNIYQFNKYYNYEKDYTGLQSSLYIDRDHKRVYTGEYAKQLYSNGDKPLQTIRSVKTRIGSDSMIQVPLISDDQNVRGYDITELSALLLKTVRVSIEQQINIDEMVNMTITIPAAFNSDERDATLDAARLAGFKNPHILDEPTAVLLSYLNSTDLTNQLDYIKPKKILVFDIGGGTLDISIAEVVDSEGDFDVKILARSPRMDFGGDDIDKYIASYFLYEFEKINPSIEKRSEEEQARIISRIVSRAEDSKISFNDKISPHLENERRRKRIKQSVNFEIIDGLNITDLTITDVSLNDILFNVIGDEGELLTPIKSIFSSKRISQKDIDLIILTGGSGKFYLIKDTLDRYFDHRVNILEYTEASAVSKGAAIHSYNQTQEGLKKINLDDLMSDNIYIRKENGFEKLIPADTSPNSQGEYQYTFDKISNQLELFLYHGSDHEEIYKYKEIAGLFIQLDKFYTENESLTVTWILDEDKIVHIYFNDQLLLCTSDAETDISELIDRFELNENKAA